MSSALVVGYVATVAVIVLSPGPSTLLATSHGVAYGVRGAAPTIGGDLSANVVQMMAAAVGLGAIVASSREMFLAVKWLGVAYLGYLGWRQWRSAPRPGGEREAVQVGWRVRYVQGLVNSAANPKAIVFFAALFPQFLDPGAALAPQLLTLGLLFLAADATALTLYASAGSRLSRWLANAGRARLAGRISGGAMLGAAGMLALRQVPEPATP